MITEYGGIHVGIATQTDSGLMVPVVRHAETNTLWDNAAEITRLAEVARDGSAKREELSGSTITITSLGPLGAIATTPIINHPEVVIVGINKMAVRPHWDGQQFVPRKMMNISCSFDHRVIDGYVAAVFVAKAEIDAGETGDAVRGALAWLISNANFWLLALGRAVMSARSAPGNLALIPSSSKRIVGRDLPQRRLHSVESADPRRRRVDKLRTFADRAPLGYRRKTPRLIWRRRRSGWRASCGG